MWDGEEDQKSCANCERLMSHDVALSKVSVANAKACQGDLLMMVQGEEDCHGTMVGRN